MKQWLRKVWVQLQRSVVLAIEVEWNPIWWSLKPKLYKYGVPHNVMGAEWLFLGISIELR